MARRVRRLIRGAIGRLGLAPLAFEARQRLRAMRFRRPVAPADGYPVPPSRLIVRVTGSADASWYLESGRLSADSVGGALRDAGITPSTFRSILDFGCGCGRVIRHWPSLTSAALHGCDVDPQLVDWCRRSLPFAEFRSNTLEPRLDYADQQFEFAYALSVMTHTAEHLQEPWIDELWRILRPGGYLLISTQGDEYLPRLTTAERDRYRRGSIVARYPQAAGSNLCSMYHPEAYVRERLARRFSVAAARPRAAAGNGHQDVYLLRKAP
jgi:SAM-dependent methyltransferase